ncbi:TPA: hypothetical protein ROY31_002033 [Bacillus thuringiensis]|uniref:hypothetical protein n=1 Tax=Bacillus thuringiensis TaxID=1428 RepID=UPI0008730DA6|nr:hypothetical protein [Bacillus thuringiensis]HDR4914380.1 hypothetical protein [Bacillus cereus]OFC75056.1 hypothetical protein BTGOE1_47020 [Bacillus thuringiensis]OFC77690.1 hypothetical protein BTGOE2_47400 [Bacillus thuringiensis]HDR4919719.1 hypothetical protein [Bacillus cereus]HDX9617044.1 hypothetical protein [Bacillus thuringiensis]
MNNSEKPFEVDEETRDFFEGIISNFLCQDVEFIPTSVDSKWLNKRRFEINDIINDFKGGEPLKEHKILLPHFEDELFPMSGAKYIRSEVQYYSGNVLKYLVEVGELEKIPHNPQHIKYNSHKKNRIIITMNYQHDKGRWGYINKEEWENLKQAVEIIQSDERLFLTEKHLKTVLNTGRNIIRCFEKEQTKEVLEEFMQVLLNEEYLLFTMPLLWNVFKIIPSSHAAKIEQQTNYLYELWDDIWDVLIQHKPNEKIDFIKFPLAKTFIEVAQRVFMKGYYFSHKDGSVLALSNMPLMYALHEQPKSYVKPDYVETWKKKAVEIALKENLQQFLPFNDVIKTLNQKKK